MAKPSDKSPDTFSKNLYGRDRTSTIKNNKCVRCGKDASIFRDALSRKEYTISGMCQACQDSIFGE